MENKIRLGSGKKRNDKWITASICLTDAETHAFEYNGKKYVKVNINIFDQPNQYGKDVGITLDTYKPEAAPEPAPAPESDDLPF